MREVIYSIYIAIYIIHIYVYTHTYSVYIPNLGETYIQTWTALGIPK